MNCPLSAKARMSTASCWLWTSQSNQTGIRSSPSTIPPFPIQVAIMKIIINADDLGLSPAVNHAIFALMEEGRITSATLMANAPAAEEAAQRLARLPRCSFGVHLVGTELRPLSSHPGLAPLLNEKGEFAGNLRRISITPAIANGIFAEWCAQIDRALALGVPVSHIDSHHHSHTEPGCFASSNKFRKSTASARFVKP